MAFTHRTWKGQLATIEGGRWGERQSLEEKGEVENGSVTSVKPRFLRQCR